MSISKTRTPVLLAVAVLTLLPGLANAQATSTVVAVPDHFPELDARAMVLRGGARDIILLHPAEATVEALAHALFALQRAREDDPDPRYGQIIPITGFATVRPFAARLVRRLERTLSDLSDRPTVRIGSLGPGRWIGLGTR